MTDQLGIDSAVGPLTLVAENETLTEIRWRPALEVQERHTPVLDEAARQLRAYFAGRLDRFDLPLAPAGSEFERAVWTAMQQIPFGETRFYGDLAAATGSGPRAVGGACGRNPIPVVIPCHRVIARAHLGGYSGAGGLGTKRVLLRLEGNAHGQPPQPARSGGLRTGSLSADRVAQPDLFAAK